MVDGGDILQVYALCDAQPNEQCQISEGVHKHAYVKE